jgi:hypothetical protein
MAEMAALGVTIGALALRVLSISRPILVICGLLIVLAIAGWLLVVVIGVCSGGL